MSFPWWVGLAPTQSQTSSANEILGYRVYAIRLCMQMRMRVTVYSIRMRISILR
jgi:hypothetical protein